MKEFIAMALVATLAFGSSVMVFAEDAATDDAAATVVEEVELEEELEEEVVEEIEEVEEEVVEEEVEEVVVEAPVNVEWTGVTTNFYAPKGELVAQYVVLPNNAALTTTMRNLVNDKYTDMLVNFGTDVVATNVAYVVSFEVDQTLTAAKIEYSVNTANKNNNTLESVVVATYYVEKATNKTITADEYAALVAAEAEVAEDVVEDVADAVESVMLPLRSYAEGLGYTVEWNDGKVTVSKGEYRAFLETDSTTYVDVHGDSLELEAPTNIDGILFVPQEFFTNALFVTVVVE